jgi:hypothetical protein
VHIATADAAVRDLNVDIVLSPLLGLEGTPFHLAVDGIDILAQPTLESCCCHFLGEGII